MSSPAAVGAEREWARDEFRSHVEAWFEDNAPRKGAPDDFSSVHIVAASTREDFRDRERHALAVTRDWQTKLFESGLARRSWPVEYGGMGAPGWQDEVVADVQSRYGVSTKMLAVALEMLPPVLFAHGSHEQRLAFLPAVVRGDASWCQLLSEPDAGSDLGGVRTLATVTEGGWSVSGQKVWTSGAGQAQHALLLARAQSPSSGDEGLACLVVEMSDPGIEVRPLRQMSGGYHFNEVFLEHVFVSEESLIGRVGGGREVLRTMLASERAAIGGGTSARSAGQLVRLCRDMGRSHEPVVRQAVAAAVARERVLDLLVTRVAAGEDVPAGGPVTKLLYSEHARLSAETALSILGLAGTVHDRPDSAPWVERLLFAPGLRIGGGTDEIQRNAIAERGLGLPRQPRGNVGSGSSGA
jgi:alkylation response protein AidB-like acyl-CoA dehydrogenase